MADLYLPTGTLAKQKLPASAQNSGDTYPFWTRMRGSREEHEDESNCQEYHGNGVAHKSIFAQVESSWWKRLTAEAFGEDAYDSQKVG